MEDVQALFDKYYVPLCHYAQKFVHDYWLAEDVVQEVFIKIWEDKGRIGTIRSAKSWLYIAVKNKCLDRLRSENTRLGHTKTFLEGKDDFIDSIAIEYEEFSHHLSECIGSLPPRCKDVFTHSRFQDMKQEGIALQMGISLKTVKAHMGKALKLIRECLSISYPEFLKEF